jgi:hypothetical protein
VTSRIPCIRHEQDLTKLKEDMAGMEEILLLMREHQKQTLSLVTDLTAAVEVLKKPPPATRTEYHY